MSSSLRRQLLAWVLLPLACAVAVDTWLTHRSSVDIASVVQDRLLLGSARMIAEQISFQNGAFEHEIPPAALELFQSQNADRIYYASPPAPATCWRAIPICWCPSWMPCRMSRIFSQPPCAAKRCASSRSTSR